MDNYQPTTQPSRSWLWGLIRTVINPTNWFTNPRKKAEKKENAQPVQNIPPERVKLEEILQSIQDGVIVADLEGYVTLISRKALEILNTASALIINKRVDEILPINYQIGNKILNHELHLKSIDGEPI